MSAYIESFFQLKDKVVLITGANGQLGRALVAAFAKSGCNVVGSDCNILKSTGYSGVTYIDCDIRNENAIECFFRSAIKQHGRVDVLINNAGVSCFEPFQERPEEAFDWVMDVNLKGTFFCTRQFARFAPKGDYSRSIVNIGSIYGMVSPDQRIYTDCNRRNSEVYGATKAGVIQMTRYFASHLANQKIRVNCVSPGGIINPDSPQGLDFQQNYGYRCPMGRMAELTEIVGAVLFFASDASSYVTGQNLAVDGGYTSW